MNKDYQRVLKGIYIRDVANDPRARQAMGLFRHLQQQMNITQADLLKLMYYKSLKDIKAEYDFEKGNCMEIDTRELNND